MSKLLAKVIAWFLYRKELVRQTLLVKLFTEKDYLAIEDQVIDQLAEEEKASDTTDDKYQGKLVTIYMPNGLNENDEGLTGITVATFPVNKYIARVLDCEDNEEYHLEPFQPQAIKTCIGISMEALNWSQTQPLDED